MQQKKSSFTLEQQRAIDEENDKLMAAGFIRKVEYTKWISNIIMVKKINDKWRIYIDYTNLNKACLKNSFPLLMIDQFVDATIRHQLLSFIDAFPVYNQI